MASPILIVVAEIVCLLFLVVYALADNERLYAAVFAAVLASILSFIVGYNFLFIGIAQADNGTTTAFTDAPIGYLFIMGGIMIAVITLALIVDGVLKRGEE